MNTANLTAFFSKVESDPSLTEKVAATEGLSTEDKAVALATLSGEVGTPFTAEELLQFVSLISDEELTDVAGGVHFSAESAVRRRDKIVQFAEDVFDKAVEYAPFLTGTGPMPRTNLQSGLKVERSK